MNVYHRTLFSLFVKVSLSFTKSYQNAARRPDAGPQRVLRSATSNGVSVSLICTLYAAGANANSFPRVFQNDGGSFFLYPGNPPSQFFAA